MVLVARHDRTATNPATRQNLQQASLWRHVVNCLGGAVVLRAYVRQRNPGLAGEWAQAPPRKTMKTASHLGEFIIISDSEGLPGSSARKPGEQLADRTASHMPDAPALKPLQVAAEPVFCCCCLVFFVVGSLQDEPGRPVSE